MMSDVADLAMPFFAGLIGTGVGTLVTLAVVSHQVGRWQGSMEQRLAECEQRLESGHDRVQAVPQLQTEVSRLGVLVDRMEAREREMGDRFVPRRECGERHAREGRTPSGGD